MDWLVEILELRAQYRDFENDRKQNIKKRENLRRNLFICNNKHIDGWNSVINVLKSSYDVVISNARKGYRNSSEIDIKLSEMDEISHKLYRLKQDLEDLEEKVVNAEKSFENAIELCGIAIDTDEGEMEKIRTEMDRIRTENQGG